MGSPVPRALPWPCIRETGCLTALDAAGDGGGLQPLDRSLPHLDVYVPSYAEANHQTGEEEPEKIIEVFRGCGAEGLLGVKLGSEGALLSPKPGEFASVSTVPPPGPVLLIDDIVYSRWTLTVAGHLLQQQGSGPVHPFVFAIAGGGKA